MAERPVIMVVDDEPAALAAILDALTRRFGGDYRIVPHLSAPTALDAVSKIKEDAEEIALVIADQWMPEMTGSEFLGRVRSIEPMAKRALLVAWGDQAASPTILQGCALGQLDNYLYKPWTPAEVHLYPLVSEFLAEWTRIHRPGMELIHIVGDELSARSNEVRELLNRNGVPYGFHHTTSPMANRLSEEHGVELKAFPAVFLLDESVLADPTTPMSFETSVPGIFAAGDVRLGSMKRVAQQWARGPGGTKCPSVYGGISKDCASMSGDQPKSTLTSHRLSPRPVVAARAEGN